jgi:hypothetical protein
MTLQINVSGLDKPEQIATLVRDAMAMSAPETRTIVPAGYRCIECYQDDGTHTPSCQFRQQHARTSP